MQTTFAHHTPPDFCGQASRFRDRAHFERNRCILTRRATQKLKRVAQILRGHPELTLTEVEGHADERGTDQHNDEIARKRAVTVRQYLIKQGISADRLVAKSYGRRRPVATGCGNLPSLPQRKACWQKNRRVVFTVLKRSR